MRGPHSGITLNSARRLLTRDFEAAGIETAALDARILVGHCTGLSAAQMIAAGTDVLTPAQFDAVTAAAKRRAGGEPVDLILGYRDFWKDRFAISQDVLSPRPETEGIIEQAITLIPPAQSQGIKILELGVGSGALILSLLREYETAVATGVDISSAALEVASGNAQALGLSCDFVESDWFENIEGRFDLIVSNQPYITDAEMTELSDEVALHDPHLALHGGVDGLDPYRTIAAQAGAYLNMGGHLILEIGYRQGADVSAILKAQGFGAVNIHKDLSGHDRIVTAAL